MAPGLSSATFFQVWLAAGLWFSAHGGARHPLAARLLLDLLRRVGARHPGTDRHSLVARGAPLLDALLVRLGLTGVSLIASAGDFGSTCNGQPVPGVAWPASSPYLTAVGGSRLVLNAANQHSTRSSERPVAVAEQRRGAGGGAHLPCRRGPPTSGLSVPGRRRSVPDVAAHASMLPGWPVVIDNN